MLDRWRFEGHALVSADDRIADAGGRTPPTLRNEADWRRFQAELDRAVLVALGRVGHAHNPNLRQRRRLVLSSTASGVERRADAWWWNPAAVSLAEALAAAAPEGGLVAVPGGQRVFDLFLDVGYDAFHLARAAAVRLGAGPTVFAACRPGYPAAEVLADAGLHPGPDEVLDPEAGVTVTVWRAAKKTPRSNT